MINRKEIVVPEFYTGYINALTEDDLMEALTRNTRQFRKLLKHIPGKKINYAYAEGKWSIKELLQHIIDAERVFVYRALSFTRKDPNMLPGFDENVWAITARAPKRKWNDLIDEFKALRAANEMFFASLDDEQLLQTGTANYNTISVAGLGFVCAGHVAHHMRIIQERYLDKKPAVEKHQKTNMKQEARNPKEKSQKTNNKKQTKPKTKSEKRKGRNRK